MIAKYSIRRVSLKFKVKLSLDDWKRMSNKDSKIKELIDMVWWLKYTICIFAYIYLNVCQRKQEVW